MNRNKLNYWTDMLIGTSFVFSALSGIVFLFPSGEGGQILGLGVQVWSNLHTYSSLLMLTGVAVHLGLHWKWMVNMTRKLFAGDCNRTTPAPCQRAAAPSLQPVPVANSEVEISRRRFLYMGGVSALAAVAGIGLGYKVLSGALSGTEGTGVETEETGTETVESTDSSPSPDAGTDTSQQTASGGVSCRFGLVNDPFPGQCHHYIDRDGDGICDRSILGSGSNQPVNL